MRINVNPDRDIAEAVLEGLKRNNGYCPFVLEKTPVESSQNGWWSIVDER